MKFFLLLFFSLISFCLQAQTLDCEWTGGETIDVSAASSNTIDCSSFTVNNGGAGNEVTLHSGGSEGANTVVTINVSGDVMIDDTINLSGGADQANRPGPGGFAGGTAPPAPADGNDGSNSAPSGSFGQGGTQNTDSGGSSCGGGGGSGGLHSGNQTITAGSDGNASGGGCANDPAPGGTAPTSFYGDPTQFSSTILGGAGGGAGGSGGENFTNDGDGGNGGSGGGAIRIIADGDITLTTNAAITANGENGKPGSTNDGGGGGGGAGGAIYLASKGQITLQTGANFSALGGTLGNGAGDGGDGSDGDDGYVRLEDSDGQISGISGASTPAASLGVFGASPITTFASDISPGCALRVIPESPLPFATIFAVGFIGCIAFARRLKAKVNRATVPWQET